MHGIELQKKISEAKVATYCKARGCDREVPEPGGALDLCVKHYGQHRRGKAPGEVRVHSATGEGGQVSFRMPALDKARLEAHAIDLKLEPSELYRKIFREWLNRRERVQK